MGFQPRSIMARSFVDYPYIAYQHWRLRLLDYLRQRPDIRLDKMKQIVELHLT